MANNRTTPLQTIPLQDGGKYVEVKQRVKHLAENFEYSIDTKYNFIQDIKLWIVTATLTIVDNGKTSVYTANAKEYENSKQGDVNNTSALENAETSAVGRACALAGIGIDNGIASAEEIKAVNRAGGSVVKRKAEPVINPEDAPEGVIIHEPVKAGSFDRVNFIKNQIKEAKDAERLKVLEDAFKANEKYTEEERVIVTGEFARRKEALKKQKQRQAKKPNA